MHSLYCWATCHCQQNINTGHSTKLLLQRIYATRKIKYTYMFTSNSQNVCPILTKFAITRQIVTKIPNTKFQENRPVGAAVIDADTLT